VIRWQAIVACPQGAVSWARDFLLALPAELMKHLTGSINEDE